MNESLKTGICFGLTSGIITTLGLMVGLHSGTHSKLTVIGGILTIAIADSFSDALGVHISEESENHHSTREVWESTIATFLTKLVFALTFIVPMVMLDLNNAIILSIIYGMSMLGMLSYYIARQQKEKPWGVIGEHLGIAFVVIVLSHFVGDFINAVFV